MSAARPSASPANNSREVVVGSGANDSEHFIRGDNGVAIEGTPDELDHLQWKTAETVWCLTLAS